MHQKVSFAHMSEGSAEDFALCAADLEEDARRLPDRLLAAVAALAQFDGCLQVTRLEHSLQSATRAYEDGREPEYVVAALVHDIGDQLAPFSHGEMVAAILRPYVPERMCWIIEHHPLFQTYYYAHHFGGDRDAREAFRDHPHYDDCREFCERYDQNCFDPDFRSRPLEFFAPMVHQVFGRAPKKADMAGITTDGDESR
ncbi:MAG TPA: HD domain-containing protein [Solirubrobacteraceae bacterium]|nr:HD domain-containing protein [Solirubrobacteraceae bacterium]